MGYLNKLTLLTAFSFVLSGQTFSQNLILSNKIPNDQKKSIQQDMQTLSKFSFRSSADQSTLDLFETKNLNPKFLTSWLQDRVQVVMEDKKTTDFNLKVKTTTWNFEFPEIMPIVETSPRPPSTQGITVMSNTGTALYHLGKTQKSLYEIEVPISTFKKIDVPISSPRSGVIKIGKGLFQRGMKANRRNDNAISNSLMRLSIFFHEARHSDGHGRHMGFLHAVCPKGHTLEGHNACDRTTNGAYAIGAQITKEFLKNCSDCSESEREILRLKYLDDMSRILKDATKVDPAPEGKRYR